MQSWIESLSLQNPNINDLWRFLPIGYLLTILIEAPILMMFLPKLSLRERAWNGVWLTACTYPMVVLVFPVLLSGCSRGAYLLVAETFAPLAECAIFSIAMRGRVGFEKKDRIVSFLVITAANLASFITGEILWIAGFRLIG